MLIAVFKIALYSQVVGHSARELVGPDSCPLASACLLLLPCTWIHTLGSIPLCPCLLAVITESGPSNLGDDLLSCAKIQDWCLALRRAVSWEYSLGNAAWIMFSHSQESLLGSFCHLPPEEQRSAPCERLTNSAGFSGDSYLFFWKGGWRQVLWQVIWDACFYKNLWGLRLVQILWIWKSPSFLPILVFQK